MLLNPSTVPLDIVPAPDGTHWYASLFIDEAIVKLAPGADEPVDSVPVGLGASMFAPRLVDGLAYVVCEDAYLLTVFDTTTGTVRKTIPTGRDPCPCDVTADGRTVGRVQHGDGGRAQDNRHREEHDGADPRHARVQAEGGGRGRFHALVGRNGAREEEVGGERAVRVEERAQVLDPAEPNWHRRGVCGESVEQ